VNEKALAHWGLSRQKQTYLMTPYLFKPDSFFLPDFGSIESDSESLYCVTYDVEEFHKKFSFVLKFIKTEIYIYIYICTQSFWEPGSSVGIATDYRMGGPGSNSGGDEIFRPSGLALGPT